VTEPVGGAGGAAPGAGGEDGGAERVRIAGVREALPAGERVIWRGRPRRALVARHVLHARLVGVYFLLTAGWWAARTAPSLPMQRALPLLALQLALGGFVLLLLHGYAAMTARATEYVVTSRRVVLRVGAVLPVTVNVPLALVAAAGVRRFRDGSGQILLTLDRHVRVSWWMLWPNVRPARLRWPEPLLRGLDDVDAAAAALRDAAAALPPEVVEAAVAEAVEAARPVTPAARRATSDASPDASRGQSTRAGRAGTSLAPT
jgi:hypothetical protein